MEFEKETEAIIGAPSRLSRPSALGLREPRINADLFLMEFEKETEAIIGCAIEVIALVGFGLEGTADGRGLTRIFDGI